MPPGKQRLPLVLLGAYVLVVSAACLLYFLRNRVYLFSSDGLYYLAIADRLLEDLPLGNPTFDPPRGVSTPQNAVVGLHVVTSRLGLVGDARLIAASVLTYLLLLSTAFPIWKLAQRLGSTSALLALGAFGALIADFDNCIQQLWPTNDGIFNALALWLTWVLCVLLADERPLRAPRDLLPRGRIAAAVLALLVLAAVLVHLRLNATVVLFAGLLTGLFTRRWSASVWIAIAFLAAGASMLVVYGDVDLGRMNTFSEHVIAVDLDTRREAAADVLVRTIPRTFLKGTGATLAHLSPLVTLVVVAGVATGLVLGRRRRDTALLLLAFSCAGAFAFPALIHFQHLRLVIYAVPLFLLLLTQLPGGRTVAVLLMALMLIPSPLALTRRYPRPPADELWLQVRARSIEIPTEAILFSQRRRHAYHFLRRASRAQLPAFEEVAQRGSLALAGRGEFLDFNLGRLSRAAREAHIEFEIRSLTPEFEHERGHALLLLEDFRALDDDG